MKEHQADQGRQQGHVNAQPTMQPTVHPASQIVLPSLLAKVFQGVDDSAGIRAEISRRPQKKAVAADGDAKAIQTCDPGASRDRPSSRNDPEEYRHRARPRRARHRNLGLENLASNAANGPHRATVTNACTDSAFCSRGRNDCALLTGWPQVASIKSSAFQYDCSAT